MTRLGTLLCVISLTAQAETAIPIDDAERRAAVKRLSKDELAKIMQETSPAVLLDAGLRAVAALGTYKYRMIKRERVKGELRPAQEIDTSMRESPFAVRLRYVSGPAAGRELIFNEAVKKGAFRVREAGLLSVLGGLWIDWDSSLAKGDSNHTIREAGMGTLLTRLKRDVELAKTYGATTVNYEGWDKAGAYCIVYTFPPAKFDHVKTRICTDLEVGLPTLVEGFDAKENLLERYEFSRFEKFEPPEDYFDPVKAKL